MNDSHTRLPIAIVGLRFGRDIVEELHQPTAASFFQPVAVCDVQKTLTDEIATQYGLRACYSLDEVLLDPGVRVVGLYTRPQGRAELLSKILAAGKDVITTKPFELNTVEARAVLHQAVQARRVLHLNSPAPEPTADLRQIDLWRKEYDLGRLVSARGEVWASYHEKSDGSWMDDPDLCPGGVMMRLGIYLLNDILDLTGSVTSAHLVTSRVRTGRPTPDNALLTMTCASGCLASIYASFCVNDGDPYSNGLTLNFEHGTIYRNVGPHRKGGNALRAYMSLVMADCGPQRVVAEHLCGDISGLYQWESLYREVRAQEGMSEKYAAKILEGVRVLEGLRSQTRYTPTETRLAAT